MKIPLSLPMLLLAPLAQGAIVQLETEYVVAFTNLTSYPAVTIIPGDTASFSITYDSSTAAANLQPTLAQYDLLGEATLQIGSFVWSASSFEIEISNNLAALTPTDEFTFRASMNTPAEFGMPLSDVWFTFFSAADLTFIESLALPESDLDYNLGVVESSAFQVNQPAGGTPIWFTSGGTNLSFTINPVPEPSNSLFLLAASAALFRRKR